MIQEYRNKIKLSERLMMSAGMVTPGSLVADVGCDHAHTSIWLVMNGIAPRTIAMDVRTGPLEKASGNIRMYGLEDKIELRLSDGLSELKENEVDSLIISGMGGVLTVQILSNGIEKAKAAKELILQPQSDIGFVRRFLREQGFSIVYEKMCRDCGKFYTAMKALPYKLSAKMEAEPVNFDMGMEAESGKNSELSDNNDKIWQEVNDEFGEYLLKSKNPVLKELLMSLKVKNERNLKQIDSGKSGLDRSARKEKVLEHEGELIRLALLSIMEIDS